jgi:hypothetical protein
MMPSMAMSLLLELEGSSLRNPLKRVDVTLCIKREFKFVFSIAGCVLM